MWRPEGWIRQRNKYFEYNQPKEPYRKTRQSDYEAGADAMYSVLDGSIDRLSSILKEVTHD